MLVCIVIAGDNATIISEEISRYFDRDYLDFQSPSKSVFHCPGFKSQINFSSPILDQHTGLARWLLASVMFRELLMLISGKAFAK